MLGFELKVVEAHGRGRRRKAQRHLTLLTDAVISHRKTSTLTKLNRHKDKSSTLWPNPWSSFKDVFHKKDTDTKADTFFALVPACQCSCYYGRSIHIERSILCINRYWGFRTIGFYILWNTLTIIRLHSIYEELLRPYILLLYKNITVRNVY